MIAIAWEFLTSKVGRYILVVGASCAAIVAIIVKVFGAGKAAERQKQQAETINAVERMHEIHGDVGGLGRGQLADELRRYSPKE